MFWVRKSVQWFLTSGAWGVLLMVRAAFLCWCVQIVQCELQALSVTGKSTSQSTTYDNTYSAHKAIDGNEGSYTRTGNADPHPWWKLDLGGEHCLGQITVRLRQDCCSNRFIGATARAGLSSNYAVNQPCGQPAASPGTAVVFLCDPPVVARWISFDIDKGYPGVTQAVLHLAKVSVMEYTWECSKTSPVPPTPLKLRSASFTVLHRGFKMVNPGPLSSDSSRHLTQCAGYCMKHSHCFSFDFSRVNRQCHLHSVNASDVQLVADAEFYIYELTKQN